MTDDTGDAGENVPSPGRRALLGTVAIAAAAATGIVRAPHAAARGRTTGRRPALVFAVSDRHAAAIQPLIDDYGRRRGVAVELRPSPDDGLLEGLTINLTQRTGAYDVVGLEDPWIPAFGGDGFLANLGGMLQARGVEPDPDFVPELLALGDFPTGSGPHAFPWLGNVQVFGRRDDRLAELGLAAPTTWDDVVETARAITEAGRAVGRYGFGLRGQTGNPAAVGFLPILRGHGGDLFDAEWRPQLETPAAMRAIATHLALAALAPPGVEKVGYEENGRNLLDGVVAQSADVWPDQFLGTADPASAVATGRMAIGVPPAQAGVRPVTMTGVGLLGIPEGSQQRESALDFILWLTAPAQQKRLLLEWTMPPTRTSVLADDEATARFPLLSDLLAAVRRAVPRPRTPYYATVETILGGAVAEAIAGRLTGEAALRGANAEVRAYMVREGVIEE